ncbi:MAG: hypothetical protein ABSD38_17570 [Syntrophorhabdales bacterium]|jgi:hypothetical protein
MAKRCVLGLLITDRIKNVPELQRTLSECGCNIKTRLGLHDTNEISCSTSGLLLLELFGDENAQAEVERKLTNVEGVQLQKMVFDM